MDRSSQSQHNPSDLRVCGEESTPRSTGSKNPWVVKKKSPAVEQEDDTCYPGVDEATETLPCYGAIGGGEPAKKPWPPAERKNVPTENADDTCNEKVDHDGDVIMDGDDIAAEVENGKVIFRTDLIPGDYFLMNRDYKVGKKLGEGSNGKVYQVHLVADKSKKMVLKRTYYKIKKEDVLVYKLLGDHNHIVKHLGGTFRGNEGHACIFMEQCDESLYNYMEKTLKRRLSVKEAMVYFLQIREAVEHLHKLAIIHKDIKAANVLMKGGRALLCDFDSAKMLRNDLTEEGLEVLGTEGFISPEVLARASHGRPADIFSMGCWLIEMTIGCPDNNSLRGKIEMLRKLDSELAELVEACVSEQPGDRPTARSLLSWPVVKRYIPAGKGGNQTRTLHALEYGAGEIDLHEEL